MRRIADLEPSVSPRRPAILERIAIALWAPREISIRPAFVLAGLVPVIVAVLGGVLSP